MKSIGIKERINEYFDIILYNSSKEHVEAVTLLEAS